MTDKDVAIAPTTEGVNPALFKITESAAQPLFNMCIEKHKPNLMYTRDAPNEDSDFRLMSHAADGFLRSLTPELIDVQEWSSPFHGCTLTFRALSGSDEYQFSYPIPGQSVLDAVQYALLNHR